jgi:hypothetical protein
MLRRPLLTRCTRSRTHTLCNSRRRLRRDRCSTDAHRRHMRTSSTSSHPTCSHSYSSTSSSRSSCSSSRHPLGRECQVRCRTAVAHCCTRNCQHCCNRNCHLHKQAFIQCNSIQHTGACLATQGCWACLQHGGARQQHSSSGSSGSSSSSSQSQRKQAWEHQQRQPQLAVQRPRSCHRPGRRRLASPCQHPRLWPPACPRTCTHQHQHHHHKQHPRPRKRGCRPTCSMR